MAASPRHPSAISVPPLNPPLPPEIRSVWRIVLVLGIINPLFCLGGKLFFHEGMSYLFPLSSRQDRFGDFTVYWQKFNLVHTAAFFHTGFPFTYPAPVALVYDVFLHHAGPHPLLAFVSFSVLALLLPAALFAAALARHGMSTHTALLFTATLLLFSWPAILVLDRGNLEILVWIALVSATWAYATGRGYLAAALFGLAASLKLFPFVFLGLFLSARQYRQLLFGAAVFFFISVLALWLLGPSVAVAFSGITAGLAFFREGYMGKFNPVENGVDHSLFALFKGIAVKVFHHSDFFPQSLSIYLACTAVFGVVLYVIRIRRLPLLNQLLLLSIASIFFTAFSGDGTLLHLYYPFALLLFFSLREQRAARFVPGLKATLLCIALLVTPISFLTTPHQRFEGQVHALLLGTVVVLALRYGFGPTLAESMRTRQPLFDALSIPEEKST